jgi:pimeloyl-ACP methyl ester carboxylesterase
MRKTLLCAAATISLTALTLTVPSAAQAKTASPAASTTIDWGTCASPGLQSRGAECAKVPVPLDYKKPHGTKIKIAISRIKHTVPDSDYQGVMLVNPGGPGGSGLTLSVLGEFVPKNAGKAYDWIGFDPRGVGSSVPAVSCDPRYAGYNRPPYVPTTRSIENAWFKKTNAYTDKCDAKNGKILDHLTTIESAMDMNSIRAALGAKKINYYGFSYGTYLGQVFATLYPDKLRRVVFDGTVDPRGVWYGDNLSQDVAFDRNINIWFGWLAKHDSTYHLGDTRAKVNKLFYATQKKLYDTPVQASGGKLGGSEWTDAFLYAGYYQSTWLGLADTFSAFINDNDVDALESAYLDASGYGDDNGYAVYLGVQCTDVKWPQSWRKWARDNWSIYATAPFETWGNAWYNEPCRHWPGKAKTPVKVTGKHVKSLLMIVETLDAATPYPGSIEVRKRFPAASLIAVPGGTTHANSLNGNACVDNAIADYLLTGVQPARKSGDRADLKCAALPQPELQPASSKQLQKSTGANITRLDLQKESMAR